MTGDRDTAIANGRLCWALPSMRLERTLLATAGDHLALERWSWRGGEPGADFAVHLLELSEVDADGLCVAWICFDPDDRAAANAELAKRHLLQTRPD